MVSLLPAAVFLLILPDHFLSANVPIVINTWRFTNATEKGKGINKSIVIEACLTQFLTRQWQCGRYYENLCVQCRL